MSSFRCGLLSCLWYCNFRFARSAARSVSDRRVSSETLKYSFGSSVFGRLAKGASLKSAMIVDDGRERVGKREFVKSRVDRPVSRRHRNIKLQLSEEDTGMLY